MNRRDGGRDPGLIDHQTAKVKHTEWEQDPKPYLSAPFRSMTTSAETHFVYHLASQFPHGNFAEIGVAQGGNTCAIGHGIRSGSLYAVDLFKGDTTEEQVRFARVRAELPKYFAEHLPHVDFRLHKMASETLGLALDVPFKFVFIDGSHEYRWALADWRAWSRLVEVDGIVAFHDTQLEGVDRVIREEVGDNWQLVRQIYSIKAFRRVR